MLAHIDAQFVPATPPVAKLSRLGSRCSNVSWPGDRPPLETAGLELAPSGTVKLTEEKETWSLDDMTGKMRLAPPGPAWRVLPEMLAGSSDNGCRCPSRVPVLAVNHSSLPSAPSADPL